MSPPLRADIERIYRAESGRVLASLVRLLGDLDRAEEALQEAFAAALEKWPEQGMPDNPCAWLISTGRFKAIDAIRRTGRGREILDRLNAEQGPAVAEQPPPPHLIDDDQLRLIFFCCHPDLPLEGRIALSLREVCGMSTDGIARAYLAPADTIKKRVTRAKALIRDRQLPWEIPSRDALGSRLNAVLHVIYLIYNEGYAASSGGEHVRTDLTREALFLSRRLVELMPSTEGVGLLALILLQESRRAARLNSSGEIIDLEQQDRSLWDQALIREGLDLLHQAVLSGRLGPYSLQAAIASVHAAAPSVAATRWDLIVGYYDMLLALSPAPVIRLNRAIAVGMDQGPAAGLSLIDGLLAEGHLHGYHILHSARAGLLTRRGQRDEARQAWEQALRLAPGDGEKIYIKQQLMILSEKK